MAKFQKRDGRLAAGRGERGGEKNKVMKNLPEPVIIIKTFGKGGKLTESKLKFSSNEKRENYGNLLDKYSS